jgi:hypothetical protein
MIPLSFIASGDESMRRTPFQALLGAAVVGRDEASLQK